jgi:hypothetical protein
LHGRSDEGAIDAVGATTRQLLEDVRASRHEAIAGDAILKSYSEEKRKHFTVAIKSLIDDALNDGRMQDVHRHLQRPEGRDMP